MEVDTAKFLESARIFRCIRLRADLPMACCARNFQKATAMACVRCPVGQYHAGLLSIDAMQDSKRGASRWDSRPSGVCVRCGRQVWRLVRGHTICVSCYNREREVLHGANAKGSRPVKAASLREARMVIVEKDGTPRLVALPGLCSGRREAQRVAERQWPGATIKTFVMDVDLPKLLPPSRTACRA
jgi:hypothetical protein